MTDEWIRRDLREAAREVLPNGAWGYFFGGAGDETTLGESREQWRSVRLRPTVLPVTEGVSLATEWHGMTLACPLVVAPIAYQGLIRPEAECGLARAAGLAGVGFVASSRSTRALASVVNAFHEGRRYSSDGYGSLGEPGRAWIGKTQSQQYSSWLCFQVYMMKRIEATKALVDMATQAGFGQFVVTLDTPILGKRYRDLDSEFGPRDELSGDVCSLDGPAFGFGFTDDEIDQAPWFGANELREVFGDRRLIGKGVLTREACERWRRVGGNDVWISNHGGRQLDRTIGTRQALLDCCPFMQEHGLAGIVDGGIAGPHDVVVALCTGARLVAVGRQVIAAYAVGGVEGAASYLVELVLGVTHILTLLGVSSVKDLSLEHLYVG